jgi:hypothetical protein
MAESDSLWSSEYVGYFTPGNKYRDRDDAEKAAVVANALLIDKAERKVQMAAQAEEAAMVAEENEVNYLQDAQEVREEEAQFSMMPRSAGFVL